MPRRQGWFAAIATIVTGLGSLALTASPAGAGDPVADARARLEAAQAAAAAAADRIEGTIAERDATQAERDATQAEVTRLEQEIVSVKDGIVLLKTRRAVLKEIVNERAAELYRNGDPSDIFGAFDDAETVGRRRKLGEAAVEADLAASEELAGITTQLETQQTELEQTRTQVEQKRAELEQKRAELDQLIVRLEGEQTEFEALLAEANAALDKAEALGALLASGTPVLGESVLSAADLASWYRTTDATPNLSNGLTIDGLAQLFIEEGAAESVRGDIAFAQAYLETGGFDFPNNGQVSAADNNFAGLGACDSCATGRRFPTPRDGVRAQIQHLRNYGDPQSTAAALANPPSPYWYGADPAIAAQNFDTFYAKGWAPIWEMMGKGKWATDSNYAGKVIGLYERIANHAIGG